MFGKTVFLFNLWWKLNTNDLSILKISLFLLNQDMMLFIVSKLDVNSFMFLPVISILVSPTKHVNLTCFIADISVSIIIIY
jgi:hypothetical protein